MNTREIVFWIYVIALAIGVVSMAAIPIDSWKYIADWQKALFGFQILLGICGVLIAYWVAEDDKEIENHRWQLRQLHTISERVSEVEQRQKENEKKN